MNDSIKPQNEDLAKHTEKLQKTNYFLTIILVIILSVGITIGIIYRDTLTAILVKNSSTKQSTQTKDDIAMPMQTSTTSGVTTAELETYKNRSIHYYNCKYSYTFYYPNTWTNNGMTYDSDTVMLYGNGVTARIQAYPNTQYAVLNDDSLYAFANAKIQSISGEQTGTRDKQRNGIHILAYAYTNPQSLVIYWQEKNYQIEMQFSGNWGNVEETNVQFLISTFKPGAYNIPECQEQTTTPQTQSAAQQTTTQQSVGCSFPNGDVEVWWDSASEEERNCFLGQGGIAPR